MEEKNHIDEYDGSNDEYTLCTNWSISDRKYPAEATMSTQSVLCSVQIKKASFFRLALMFILNYSVTFPLGRVFIFSSRVAFCSSYPGLFNKANMFFL